MSHCSWNMQILYPNKPASGCLTGSLCVWYGPGYGYATNIVFNIYNKQVLKVYPYPFTSTLCQFGVGAVFVLLMWASGRA